MNNIILVDTLEKNNSNIIDYFKDNKIKYIKTRLDGLDDLPRCDYTKYEDYSVCIDVKQSNNQGILELCGNLTSAVTHDRLKKAIYSSVEKNCRLFIYLIYDKKVHCLEDVKTWSSDRTKVTGTQLYKTMCTFKENREKEYPGLRVEYIFTTKKEVGKRICELLEGDEGK